MMNFCIDSVLSQKNLIFTTILQIEYLIPQECVTVANNTTDYNSVFSFQIA